MLYIFDGGDLSGKTSLAKEFANKVGIPYIKKDLEVLKYQNKAILAKDNIELIQKFFWNTIYPVGKKYDLVIDRSLLSSLVYSIIFDRKEDLSYIYKLFKSPDYSKEITLFFVTSTKESLTTRFYDRGEALFSLDELFLNQSIFEKVVNTINKDKELIITVNNNNGDNLSKIVESLIRDFYGK